MADQHFSSIQITPTQRERKQFGAQSVLPTAMAFPGADIAAEVLLYTARDFTILIQHSTPPIFLIQTGDRKIILNLLINN